MWCCCWTWCGSRPPKRPRPLRRPVRRPNAHHRATRNAARKTRLEWWGLARSVGITDDFLKTACKKGNALYAPVEVVLKGKEAALPKGKCFYDKQGIKRTDIRARWYLSPQG